MQCLYKYPQAPFPYAGLVAENNRRWGIPSSFEYELMDTGIFDQDKYFDVLVTYANNDPEDLLVQIEVTNRGPDTTQLEVMPARSAVIYVPILRCALGFVTATQLIVSVAPLGAA
jgi:hypothetical protein